MYTTIQYAHDEIEFSVWGAGESDDYCAVFVRMFLRSRLLAHGAQGEGGSRQTFLTGSFSTQLNDTTHLEMLMYMSSEHTWSFTSESPRPWMETVTCCRMCPASCGPWEKRSTLCRPSRNDDQYTGMLPSRTKTPLPSWQQITCIIRQRKELAQVREHPGNQNQ